MKLHFSSGAFFLDGFVVPSYDFQMRKLFILKRNSVLPCQEIPMTRLRRNRNGGCCFDRDSIGLFPHSSWWPPIILELSFDATRFFFGWDGGGGAGAHSLIPRKEEIKSRYSTGTGTVWWDPTIRWRSAHSAGPIGSCTPTITVLWDTSQLRKNFTTPPTTKRRKKSLSRFAGWHGSRSPW